MKRRFKLIKKYPGCYIEPGEVAILHSGLCYFPENGGNGINPDHVEKYPEFWQEIKDEYPKIISFKHIYRGNIAYIEDDGLYNCGIGASAKYPLDAMLYGNNSVQDGKFNIYQVAKNKDEIFTIGDKVIEGLISGFRFLECGKLYQYHCCDNGNWISIDCAEHISSIFTTYDGIDLFDKNDKVFGVFPKDNWQTNYHSGDGIPVCYCIRKEDTSWLYFSTKEIAEKYIKQNKPKFSVKDIENALKISQTYDAWKTIEKFKRNLGI
jgi:hypothetical protein